VALHQLEEKKLLTVGRRDAGNLRAGDWVEVRSKEEILRTLDRAGRLEDLPFMPQMFNYCGQRFRVYKRAHKTCDTVNQSGGRRVSCAVHLDIRCDGEAFGGCDATCLIFWKVAWLKPSGKNAIYEHPLSGSETSGIGTAVHSGCTESDVLAGTRIEDQVALDNVRYVCQATQLPSFSTLLPWWDIRQYLEDYTSGNVPAGRILAGLLYASYNNLSRAGIGLGRPMRWMYDRFQALWGGIPYPRHMGSIPAGEPTPTNSLDLKPGERVRVKPFREILTTLNTENKNRGLYFDAEHVPYCGGVYPVRSRVKKFVNEKTGKMVTLQTDAIILEGVWCRARYSGCRMFCPRSIYPWWREVWLERISENMHENRNRDFGGRYS
jgi:hypothetical protein